MKIIEIERTWLLKKLPSLEPNRKYWIEQFYLSTSPEVRLRRCRPHGDYENKVPYRLTLKGEGTLSREEAETAVSEEFYQTALDMVNFDPIQKHYLCYDIGGHTIEISVVLNEDNFIYAEVEFENEEQALNYQFPWIEIVEREITDEYKFKMKNYWESRIVGRGSWPPEKPLAGGYYF